MNPRDTHKRGIKNNDKVRVYNTRGEIFIIVNLDNSLRPGNVVIYNGYWNTEGGSPNLLSKGRETDMGHGRAAGELTDRPHSSARGPRPEKPYCLTPST